MTAERDFSPPHCCVVILSERRVEARKLRAFFTEEGWSAGIANSDRDLDRALVRSPATLLILSVDVEVVDVYRLCQAFQGKPGVGVLLLRNASDAVSTVVGLEMGADDVVARPFSLREIMARARAVMRRRAPGADFGREVAVKGWTLRFEGRTLRSPLGKVHYLTSNEFTILSLLMTASDRLFSREDLGRVLHMTTRQPNRRSVDVLVSRLRAKLGVEGRALIRTVRSAGYSLLVPREETLAPLRTGSGGREVQRRPEPRTIVAKEASSPAP